MFRVVVVYSRSLSGFLLGGSWCGYVFVVLSWGAKCGWELWAPRLRGRWWGFVLWLW